MGTKGTDVRAEGSKQLHMYIYNIICIYYINHMVVCFTMKLGSCLSQYFEGGPKNTEGESHDAT